METKIRTGGLKYKVNHYEDYVRKFGDKPAEVTYVWLQVNADRIYGWFESWYTVITPNRNRYNVSSKFSRGI